MADDPETDKRIVELDELLVRPGTYFNPQTEVVVVVDDSMSIDQEVFNMEDYEGAEWVRVADEVPVDEDRLDATLQRFQTTAPGSLTAEVADEEEPVGADAEPIIEGPEQ